MCRIAIVDDSAIVRNAIKSLLVRSPRWVAREAASHPEALRICDEFKPNLVLVDLSLGSANGLATARALRQSIPGAKIIIMSAQDPNVLAEMRGSFGFECVDKSELMNDLPRILEQIESEAREDSDPFSMGAKPQ